MLNENNKLVEAQRLDQRTRYDLEMMRELGYRNGIENYSRFLSGRGPGYYRQRWTTIAADAFNYRRIYVGISNRAMFKGDRSRKQTLVEFGFRLSALDNRPLRFEEWEERAPQAIYVSATPGPYDIDRASRRAGS